MISIPSIQGAAGAAALRRKNKAKASDADFSGYLAEAEATGETEALAAAAPVTATNPLLGIQEISDEQLANKQAVRHGHAMLDQLESVRLALMSGGIPVHMLSGIEALSRRERAQVTDPALTELLDEIDVRVAVERAKLELALQRSEET